jgi:endogenous inhibitor of DNA gyrase (YacG/DUF329 family)
MIEIQCPMCGEYVSDEVDTCPFCQARLKPLQVEPEADEKIIEPENDPAIKDVGEEGDIEQDAPADNSEGSKGEDQPSSSAEEEVSDWLSGLERTANEEDKAPAWLSSIVDETKKEESSSVSEDETDNWLNDLRDGSDLKDSLLSEETLQEPSEEPIFLEGIPDWMKSLQDDVDSRADASKLAPENQPEIENVNTPDWLLRLQAETQAFAAAQEKSLSAREEETPDLPEKTSDVESKPPMAGLPVEDETPAWLEDIQDEPGLDKVESTASESSSPAWLKDLPSDISASDEDAAPDAVSMEGIPAEFEDVGPDLTSSMGDATLPGPVPADTGEELSSNGGQPDWLINLKAEGEASQQEEGGQLKTPISAHQDDIELVPGWLQGLEKEEPLSSETSVPAQDEQAAGDLETIPSGDLPDWLAVMQADAEAPKVTEENPEVELTTPDIKPAELPSWVQAMQPVEAMMADAVAPESELAQITENAGPLAGLPGVLPVAPVFGGEQKPLIFSARLHITDDQQQKASQLEQMLGDETRAKPTVPKSSNLKPRILRWVVAFLLIAAVLIPAIGGAQITPELATCPPEVLATTRVLFGLPASSPVLLVFDYEPAYSGELEAAAAPLVGNLLLTSARVAILSTSPTGPALAEYFLKTTQAQDISQNSQQVANLGYLAGGASGVLSFATDPSQTLPYALDGSQPWQSSLLHDVHLLSDFAAVIILTDNSDTARIWVEQAGPLLGGKPMLMAISAQAEPMIRPYYDSHQVQGMVTGLAGGKAYEQALSLPGLAKRYWDSFSLGLLIAELVIIFAGLWSLVSILRNRKPAQKEEE